MSLFGRLRKDSPVIEHYKQEVNYLRSLVSDLHAKLLAFNDSAFQNHLTSQNLGKSIGSPSYVNPLGELIKMEANTKEQKEQKEQAASQIREILGAGLGDL